MVSPRAARACAKWLSYCTEIGWSKSALPKLADLWWQYHDEETGELV
jgi:hypothetical protein